MRNIITRTVLVAFLAPLLHGGCVANVGTPSFAIPADAAAQCRDQCRQMEMVLSAVVTVGTMIACACQPEAAPAAPQPEAAPVASQPAVLGAAAATAATVVLATQATNSSSPGSRRAAPNRSPGIPSTWR
jgi:hypothetical protein